MAKRHDWIMALLFALVLLAAVGVVFYNDYSARPARIEFRKIDAALIDRQVQSGNLSDREARFFKALPKEGN